MRFVYICLAVPRIIERKGLSSGVISNCELSFRDVMSGRVSGGDEPN